MTKKVLAVCLSPCFQSVLEFRCINENEVNRCISQHASVSGKGTNVCRFVKKFGSDGAVLTHLGGPRRNEYIEEARKEGLKLICSQSEEGGIRTCTTLINREHDTSTELVQESYPVTEEDSNRVLSLFKCNVKDYDCVVISGTKAPGYDSRIYSDMTKYAVENGKTVILDIKGDDLKDALRFRPKIIKPNLSEFAGTFTDGPEILENQDAFSYIPLLEQKARSIHEEYGAVTILSHGSSDALYYDVASKSMKTVPSVKVNAVNTIGCGDVLTSALAVRLTEGSSVRDALAFGMKMAAEKAKSMTFDF